MRYALIITLGVCYYLGWLPASLVVPALLAFSLLRVPSRSAGRIPRRGGYIAPPSTASAGVSPGTVQRVQTYTDSSRAPGLPSEVRTAFMAQAGPSRTIEPGSYMSAWGFAPGRLTTDADSHAPVEVIDLDGSIVERFLAPKAVGDCGCEDAA